MAEEFSSEPLVLDCAHKNDACVNLSVSPKLSKKTQEEIVAENQVCDGDPDNYPLNSTWCFWFDRSQRGGNAGNFFANLRHIAAVNTIKAFWSVYNNLPACNLLKERDSYHLMRDLHRRPVWEDLDNVDGGVWTIKVNKEHTVRLWQEMCLAAVGEQLSNAVNSQDEICGVSVRIRYDTDVIQVWNQDANFSSQAKVLDKIKELVPSLTVRSFFYSSNREKVRDTMTRPSSSHTTPHVVPPTGDVLHGRCLAMPLELTPPTMTGFPMQRRYTGAPPPLFPSPPHHPYQHTPGVTRSTLPPYSLPQELSNKSASTTHTSTQHT